MAVLVTLLLLLLLLPDVLDLQRIDARQANDFAEELGIRWVLVAEVEVSVALSDECVEQPILLSVFEELRPLERDHESSLELSHLGEGTRDDFEG